MTIEKDFSPTSGSSRIELLDVFRGFAIFGIFVVNIEIMNCLIVNQGTFGQQWTDGIDIFSYRILQLFFYSKFFPIFSFLFGLGIGMQAIKFSSNKDFPLGFLIRRMAILFIFGMLHISFLWSGDILHLYAAIGTLSLPLVHKRSGLILTLSIALFVFPFYGQLFEFLFGQVDFSRYINQYASREIVEIIRHGASKEQMDLRWADYFSNIPLLLAQMAPVASSMFLLGLYFAKKGFVDDIKEIIYKIKKPSLAVFILILAYRLFFIFFLTDLELYRDPLFKPIFLQLIFLSDVLTGLFYLYFIAWLYHHKAWKKLLNPLKYVGRMALSNYIFQSLMGLILFYSVGFSLYETLSPPLTIMTASMLFAIQIVLSRIWLRYFKYGPLEWVWRVLSYGKWMTIKLKKP